MGNDAGRSWLTREGSEDGIDTVAVPRRAREEEAPHDGMRVSRPYVCAITRGRRAQGPTPVRAGKRPARVGGEGREALNAELLTRGGGMAAGARRGECSSMRASDDVLHIVGREARRHRQRSTRLGSRGRSCVVLGGHTCASLELKRRDSGAHVRMEFEAGGTMRGDARYAGRVGTTAVAGRQVPWWGALEVCGRGDVPCLWSVCGGSQRDAEAERDAAQTQACID